jgi:hypothetical protein
VQEEVLFRGMLLRAPHEQRGPAAVVERMVGAPEDAAGDRLVARPPAGELLVSWGCGGLSLACLVGVWRHELGRARLLCG